MRLASLIIILSWASFASAKLRSVTMTSDQDWASPRWMYDEKAKVSNVATIQQLVAVKRAQLDKNFSECVSLARKASQKSSGLKNWLTLVELDCAYQALTPESKDISLLVSAIQTVEKNQSWLLYGPQVSLLKPLYLEAKVALFEKQIKVNRVSAWSHFDQLQNWRDSLNHDQEARVFRSAGELAFLEQNISLAMDLFSRSLNEKESTEVRRRLESVRSAVAKKEDDKAPESTAEAAVSTDDKDLIQRMETTLASGDLLAAIEDGVKVISEFPGSQSAKWASDKVLDIYLSLGNKNDENYKSIREKAVSIMLKVDSSRLLRWANNAFVKNYYADSQKLAEGAYEKFQGHPDSTKALQVAALSAYYLGKISAAEKWFEKLVQAHGGSEEAKGALFKLGLIRFRAKKWAEASAYFERLLAIAPQSDWEYLALHWHWRALQRLNSSEANKFAERLAIRYPMTYYGLRASAELNGGVLNLARNEKSLTPLKSEVWLSESQSQGYERLLLLLKAGWFDEAQKEIASLPEPLSPEDKLVRARLLGAAFNHYEGVRLFNDVWTNRPDLYVWAQAKAAFPKEFANAIDKESKATQVEGQLIRSLIRQESTFRTRAISGANAYGVMQVMPATAQEVAQSSKWKTQLVLPTDLFNPATNIRIGSIYLGRMIKAFKGHVPLALAAYNAGIGRMRKWLAARPELADLETKLNSNPEDEIWIDELPWDETSAYVKSILRNLLIYQMIDAKEIKVIDPVWRSGPPKVE